VLTKLGWIWELGMVSVSQEHMVSALVDRLLSEIPVKKSNKDRVVAGMTAPHEKHTLGLKMLLLALNQRGYKTHYIGECVPLEDFQSFIEEHDVDISIFSITSPFFQDEMKNYFNAIDVKEKILVGMGSYDFKLESVEVYRNYKKCLEAIDERN
jgi:methanogenic corrinoid protein MtbC1